MISTTFLSIPVLLINEQPDWSTAVSADFDKQNKRTSGLSQRENREEMSDKLVTTLRYSSLLNAAESSSLRVGVSTWANQPILCPFWPAETLIKNYTKASVQGLLRVWYEPDWSFWELNTGTGPTTWAPTPNARTAPVMYGRFESFPVLHFLSGNDDESVDFAIVESGDSSYALEPLAVTLTNGTTVNGLPVPQMAIPFVWGGNQMTTDVRIKQENVGFGRATADTFYAQTPRTQSTLYFDTLNTSEVAYILKLFRTCAGSLRPFWCASPYSLATLVYGRFFGDKLTISWAVGSRGQERANLSFDFLSLPTEQSLPAGETFGGTIGPIAARWFGYAVTCGSQSWYFTSYESTLVGPSSNSYTPQNISHGQIDEEINLVVNDCELTVHAWSGCPFSMLVQQLMADPMYVTIYEGLVSSPSTAAAIYTGQAMAPKTAGARMTIKLRGPSAILSTKGPRIVLQETCAAVLGDSRCTISLGTFSTTQTLNSITAGVGDFNVSALGWATAYFRGGFAERTVGAHIQRIPIADSYALAGSGHLGILFGAPVTPAPTGSEAGWVLYAGCDGYFSTCKNKFNNKLNFRGHPYMPKTNPSVLPTQTASTGTGKKS